MTNGKKTEESSGQASPYMDGRREWSERYGDYVKAAKDWKRVALLSALISLVAVSGVVVLASQSKVTPYIVRIDGHNEVFSVARVSASQPNPNEIRAAVANWIVGARTVYTDPEAQKKLIDATYSMTLPNSAAYRSLVDYDRQNNPYERAATETVACQITMVSPISSSSWQVEWHETVKSANGKTIHEGDWQAIISVEMHPATDQETILANPLGVYVNQFTWSHRIAAQ